MCKLGLCVVGSSAYLSRFCLLLLCFVTTGACTHYPTWLVWAIHFLPRNTGQLLCVPLNDLALVDGTAVTTIWFHFHSASLAVRRPTWGFHPVLLDTNKMSMLNNELRFSLFPDGEMSFIPGSSPEQSCAFGVIPPQMTQMHVSVLSFIYK